MRKIIQVPSENRATGVPHVGQLDIPALNFSPHSLHSLDNIQDVSYWLIFIVKCFFARLKA
jgi:hypothetical protein